MILFYGLVGSDESRPFCPHCWKAELALAHHWFAAELAYTFDDVQHSWTFRPGRQPRPIV